MARYFYQLVSQRPQGEKRHLAARGLSTEGFSPRQTTLLAMPALSITKGEVMAAPTQSETTNTPAELGNIAVL
jgi:hypothetical protein